MDMHNTVNSAVIASVAKQSRQIVNVVWIRDCFATFAMTEMNVLRYTD